ncbi:hypothetical protein LJ737_20225 [Hymenobacter sp. 15J16-1T3B]|uniref:hypothetical protein n=1 Tax=Hymenobacter sp. 15J16-1T3B TaxID=2886941 RepID=UPI001D128303|nr:hypothetical protein [Hymenobacter sp. 15J16-1T3B]MCC3159579.1 hypothetical protein [Hymenobacter sp. 15J16-1T3B]
MRTWLASGWAKWVVVLLYVAAGVTGFGIVNTMVSLKYETRDPGQCLSDVTGRDLCADLRACQIETVAAAVLATVLLGLHVWASSRTPGPKPD